MSRAGFSREPRVYIPKCRKEDTPPPTFHIRRLNPLELLDISAKYSDENETVELGGIEDIGGGDRKVKISLKTVNNYTRSKYDVLARALTGWENIEDESGQSLPFSLDNIPYLDMDIINELSDVAQGTITANEAKNSQSPLA